MNHIIDTSNTPYIPEGLKIEEHNSNGKVDATKISLWISDEQKNGYIEGNKLRKILKDKNPLNATVLDYLFEHQELIPEEWKGKVVYFWGTVYRRSDGRLYVRCLCWGDGAWSRRYYWLGIDWLGNDPAALLASTSSSESKTSLEPLSLDEAIRVIKEGGYKVIKEL